MCCLFKTMYAELHEKCLVAEATSRPGDDEGCDGALLCNIRGAISGGVQNTEPDVKNEAGRMCDGDCRDVRNSVSCSRKKCESC